MDVRRMEKISGLEALKKIGEEVTIYDAEGLGYFYDPNGIFYRRHNKKFKTDNVDMLIAEIASKEWYVRKPFDIREEMLARPYEWVGAYKTEKGTWFRVGFDMKSMVAVKTNLPYLHVADIGDVGITSMTESDFDKCIPIEDVPTDAFAN